MGGMMGGMGGGMGGMGGGGRWGAVVVAWVAWEVWGGVGDDALHDGHDDAITNDHVFLRRSRKLGHAGLMIGMMGCGGMGGMGGGMGGMGGGMGGMGGMGGGMRFGSADWSAIGISESGPDPQVADATGGSDSA